MECTQKCAASMPSNSWDQVYCCHFLLSIHAHCHLFAGALRPGLSARGSVRCRGGVREAQPGGVAGAGHAQGTGAPHLRGVHQQVVAAMAGRTEGRWAGRIAMAAGTGAGVAAETGGGAGADHESEEDEGAGWRQGESGGRWLPAAGFPWGPTLELTCCGSKRACSLRSHLILVLVTLMPFNPLLLNHLSCVHYAS
jgi:hypothetical protein